MNQPRVELGSTKVILDEQKLRSILATQQQLVTSSLCPDPKKIDNPTLVARFL